MLTTDPRTITGNRVGLRSPGDPGDVAFVLGVLKRQRRVIFNTMMAALAVGLLIYVLAAPTYKATSTVLIDFKRLAALDENFSTATGRIDSSAVLSQIELLKSEGVLDRVVISEKLDEDQEFVASVSSIKAALAKIGLATDPMNDPPEERRRLAIEALKNAATIERVDLSYAISITMASRSARKSADLANAMSRAYIADQLEAKRMASEKASDWFSQRIAELQQEVSNADLDVINYRLKHNIITTDGKFIDEQQVSDLSQKVLQASFARAGAEAKVVQADEMVRTGATQSALVDEFSNEVVIQLRNAYLDTKRQMTDLSIRYGATHDAVTKARSKMNELQNAMNDEMRRIQEGARSDLMIEQTREKTLQKELSELSGRSMEGREARVQLMQLESASETVKAIRDTFMSRYVEGIQKQSFPLTEARVITVAQAPYSPSFPTPIKTVGGSVLFGLGFGCLLAVAREAFSRRLRFKRQAEEVTGVPCLGFLPEIDLMQPADVHSSPLRDRVGGFYLETLRSVTVGIDLRRQGQNVVIGIVSASAEEGKTVTSSTFAQICAETGARTLLVDANLRHASLSALLAPKREFGIAEVIGGQAEISDALQDTPKDNLQFLPCFGGARPSHPGAMISSDALRLLMQSLSTQYRYIVLDLPALDLVSDARALADIVDGFLMVSRWDKTETHALDEALRNNPQVREKLIGSVLNRANLKELIQLGESAANHTAAYHA